MVEKELMPEDYRNVVDSMGDDLINADGETVVNRGAIFRGMNVFRSHLHEVYTEMVNKVALSYFDDKRCLIPNSYSTYAWFHKDIPKI